MLLSRRARLVAITLVFCALPSSSARSKSQKTRSKKPRQKIIVYPGQSIQNAIDNASDGDTIIVKAGTYTEESNERYGLRVTKNNIKLFADDDATPANVKVVAIGVQETGIFIAPEGCDYKDDTCDNILHGFSLKGISVEEFPVNGIQTRWVNDFQITNSHSVNNLNNGIYLTLSSKGKVDSCTSSGSLDSGLWVAGSRRVQVTNTEIFDCVTGLEVTVSHDVYAANNIMHNNVVGVGLYHANMAGTKPNYPSYDNWVFENNIIANNNRVNNSNNSFSARLPSGVGVLIVGVRGHTFRENLIKDNSFEGMLMAGFCSVLEAAFGSNCDIEPPLDGDPSANYNTIIDNIMYGNGGVPSPELPFLPSLDIVYGTTPLELGEAGEQNCFEGNQSDNGGPVVAVAVDLSTFVVGPLPSAGCVD